MSARILFYLIIYYVFTLHCVRGEYGDYDIEPDTDDELEVHVNVEGLVENFQRRAISAEKRRRGGVTHIEDIEPLYEDMIEILDDLIYAINNSTNIFKFHKVRGIERTIIYALNIDYEDLKIRILILLKVIFKTSYTTTEMDIPITIVDYLLDVFEKDNLALKSLSLQVLGIWLPNNPQVQARVMKLKGLEPFYDKVELLDADALNMLLVLFDKLLKEHLKVRSLISRTFTDENKKKIYQRIGLIERMQTPTVCNGLLNIFANIWSYNSEEPNIMITVLELLKNVKQFCLKLYHGQSKAVKLFTALQNYVNDSKNKQYFELKQLNVTEIALVLGDYVDKLKNTVKEEL